MSENDGSGNAGAGAGGGQNQNSGDGNANANAGSSAADNRNLNTADVDSIVSVVSARMKDQISQVIQESIGDLRKNISQEITGATKRQIEDALNKLGGDTGRNRKSDEGNQQNAHGNNDANDFYSRTVELPGGVKMSVADLGKAYGDLLQKQEEYTKQEAERKAKDTLFSIKTALQKRNVLPGMLDLVADGIAARIVSDNNGNLIAKGVEVPNPLPNVEPRVLVQDLSLDAYLDVIVKNSPHMVASKMKEGSGGGGNAGGGNANTGGKAPFTAQQILDGNPDALQWMTENESAAAQLLQVHQNELASSAGAVTMLRSNK